MVAFMNVLLCPEPLGHFVARAAVAEGLLKLLRLVDIKNHLAGVAADQHHIIIHALVDFPVLNGFSLIGVGALL